MSHKIDNCFLGQRYKIECTQGTFHYLSSDLQKLGPRMIVPARVGISSLRGMCPTKVPVYCTDNQGGRIKSRRCFFFCNQS